MTAFRAMLAALSALGQPIEQVVLNSEGLRRPEPVKVHATVAGSGKCARKGHRPPTKYGRCSRCDETIA